MGGAERIEAAEAASILQWWLEAGVDVPAQDEARNWLQAAAPPPPPAAPTARSDQAPETHELFRTWQAEAPAPLAGAGLPAGAEGAPVMLMADLPSAEDSAAGQPLSGESWRLVQRMVRAIGLEPEAAYCASLFGAEVPGGRPSEAQLKECAAAARRNIALARPKRLLLFGEGPCRALLGKSLAEARGHVHAIEGVRAVATFEPRFLIRRPSYKALAWQDLLLLMEDAR